ncbi:MAG TPA: DUF4340 domain-containing protein [Candidatus Nitrosotalea sp.]|nr:DUF4340 domain-containing protein [Candidatus Nitrosotalea sp.]
MTLLLGLAVVVGIVLSRTTQSQPEPIYLPCGTLNTLALTLSGGGRSLILDRSDLNSPWTVGGPTPDLADQVRVDELLDHLSLILPSSPPPGSARARGLTPPRLQVMCRVQGGGSYNLSVGNPSPGGAGYYAERSGDSRVVVIPAVAVESIDRTLVLPPIGPGPSPSG